MGFVVKLTASVFHRKPLPLKTILGNNLAYGNTEEYVQTICGELGRNEFIAYLPEKIGRGFQVIWHEGESRRVILRLPLPCCRAELDEFFNTVERIATFWHAGLEVDGKKTHLANFLAMREEAQHIYREAVRETAQRILDTAEGKCEIIGAMWPMRPGHAEAKLFLLKPEEYDVWLHERQAIDATYYAVAYAVSPDERSAVAMVGLMDAECPTIFPNAAPPQNSMTRHPQTGRLIPVSEWTFTVVADGEPIASMTYDELRAKLPPERVSRYDGDKILIQPMSAAELRALYTPKEK